MVKAQVYLKRYERITHLYPLRISFERMARAIIKLNDLFSKRRKIIPADRGDHAEGDHD